MIIAQMYLYVCLCVVVESIVLFDYYHRTSNICSKLYLEIHSICNMEYGLCDDFGSLWFSNRQIMKSLNVSTMCKNQAKHSKNQNTIAALQWTLKLALSDEAIAKPYQVFTVHYMHSTIKFIHPSTFWCAMMKLYWLHEICVRWKRNDGQLTIVPCSDLFCCCCYCDLSLILFFQFSFSVSILLLFIYENTILSASFYFFFFW